MGWVELDLLGAGIDVRRAWLAREFACYNIIARRDQTQFNPTHFKLHFGPLGTKLLI